MGRKLKPSGYNYAVIDEGWYTHNPEDRPKPERLKCAVDVADQTEACPWDPTTRGVKNNEAGQAW